MMIQILPSDGGDPAAQGHHRGQPEVLLDQDQWGGPGDGRSVGVINVMGRVFMHPELDDPFKSAEVILDACPLKEQADAIIFDFHAEATSEKQCFGHFVDGRASFVVGTHTHVPTADAWIMPGGTAYITDVGMTGARGGVIGVRREQSIAVMRTHACVFTPATTRTSTSSASRRVFSGSP